MIQVKCGHSRNLVAAMRDQWGNPGAVSDNKPGWTMDPIGGQLVVAEDGLSAMFTAGEGLGVVSITIEGASNGQPVLDSIQIQIIPGDLASIEIIPGNQI